MMTHLAALAVFGAFASNLVLHCGLGIKGLAEAEETAEAGTTLMQGAAMFLVVFFLWIPARFLGSFLGMGLDIFLLFPLSALACAGLEAAADRFIPRYMGRGPRMFQSGAGYGGLCPLALLITVTLAEGFLEALVLSFSFALSSIAVIFIIRGIRLKSRLERIPRFMRMTPLLLLSMGLLALIFSAIGEVFLNALW